MLANVTDIGRNKRFYILYPGGHALRFYHLYCVSHTRTHARLHTHTADFLQFLVFIYILTRQMARVLVGLVGFHYYLHFTYDIYAT